MKFQFWVLVIATWMLLVMRIVAELVMRYATAN
jgi:hypothetical protein